MENNVTPLDSHLTTAASCRKQEERQFRTPTGKAAGDTLSHSAVLFVRMPSPLAFPCRGGEVVVVVVTTKKKNE